MRESFDGTIDWEEYWTTTSDMANDDANASSDLLVEPFLRFLDWAGKPKNFADVGCGGGTLIEAVTHHYPTTSITGYDAAESVIRENRRRSWDPGLDDPRFEQARLPDFDPERSFDIVSCLFTLCYVREVDRALEALYDAVKPGGYLVCTYHNRHAAALFRTFAAAPEQHIPPASAWDPDRFAERFQLVIEGESTLSYRQIHQVLGRWPRSVWSVDDDLEPYGAWRQNPFVFIPK